MTARRLFVFVFAGALLAGFGCSNDDGGGGSALSCFDGGDAAANSVNTACGAASDSDTQQVDVVMGGPSSGTTPLRGLNFDVTFDPTKLTFESASSTSPLFPPTPTGGPLILVQLDPTDPGRVIVSIQQTGDSPAVSVGPGQHVVLSLSFQRVAGATFAPTPVEFDNAEPTPPSTAITFASGTSIAFD